MKHSSIWAIVVRQQWLLVLASLLFILPTQAVNTTSQYEMTHCLLYGNWTNSTACPGNGVMTEGDSGMIAIAMLIIGLLAFLVTMVVVINQETFIMKVLKLFFLMISCFLTVAIVGLSIGFASEAGLSSSIIDVLNSVYRVVVWVVRVFVGFLFLYLFWEVLTAFGQHKAGKVQKQRELEESV